MIIGCPSCSARYQLADSKIKPKGTKVRCPRCSHTFTVFPENEEDNISDRTELFVRRDDVYKPNEPPASSESKPTPKPTPKPQPPAEAKPDLDFDNEDMFNQKTAVSMRAPHSVGNESQKSQTEDTPVRQPEDPIASAKSSAVEESSEEKPKQSKVFEDPARVSQPKKEASQEAPPAEEEDFRPFGDATLFEIQKTTRKRKWPKYAIAASVFALAGAVLYFAYDFISNYELPSDVKVVEQKSVGDTQEATLEVIRPSGWYQDDPQVYQETLAQIAALPKSERDKPENRALLSEALILNGLLNDQTDQVNRGLGMIPGLVIAHPGSPASYYGTAAYAIWNNDKSTLSDLMSRWPEAHKDAPEYRLVEIVYLSKTGKLDQALELGSDLFTQKPGFQRANNYIYYLSLQDKALTEKFFDERSLGKLERFYERHRSILRKHLSELPRLQRAIDRLRGKSGSSSKKEISKAKAKPRKKPSIQKEDPPAPKKQPVKKTVEVPRNQKSSTARRNTRRQTKLPKPDSTLVAKNRSLSRDKSQARRLFNQGNQQFNDGNIDAALDSYRQVIKLDHEFAEVYKRMGMIYMSRQQSDRALKSFKLYLKLKPETDDKKLVEGWISSLQ